MKKILSFVLSLLCLAAHAYEERNFLQKAADPARLKQTLSTDQKWVHYPSYADRSGWERLLGYNQAYCIAQGEKYLNYEWQVVKVMDYLEFARSGSRSQMETPHNSNITAISALFMAEMAEGKGRFMNQLVNGIFHLCEMTTWAAAAHLSLQKVKGAFPKLGDHAIDLVAGDVGATFAWIYFFLKEEFNKINPLISERLYYEIDSRILTPYLTEARFWWMAENLTPDNIFVNNWNAWCNASVLQCFLLVEKDSSRMLRGVYKTMVSADKFLNYVGGDGACEEGTSYWEHAAGKIYDYLQILYDATNGQVSIFSQPLIKNMGEYIPRSYINRGWTVNFADASAKSSLDYWLIYRYGKSVNSPEMQQFAAYLKRETVRELPITRDVYRMIASLECESEIMKTAPNHPVTQFVWYPQTEVCYMSEGRFFLAAKGGYNDESHNHNDAGTFILYIDVQPLFIDAGVGTYTRKTFSSERYTIWTMQSDYHNLPRINGFSQSYGKRYKAANVKVDGAKKTFSADIAGAYPAEAGVVKWLRSYKLSKKSVTIEDNFEIKNATAANQVNFMTWGKVDISQAGVVSIEINGITYRMEYDKNEFEAATETIELDDTRLSKVWGSSIYRVSLNAKKTANKGTYRFNINY